MKLKISQIFQFLFLTITVQSILVHTSLDFNIYFLWLIIDVMMLIIAVKLKPIYFGQNNDFKLLWPIYLFLAWNIFAIFRGMLVASDYWEWKFLFSTSMVLLIPLTMYIFTNKYFVQKLISFWLLYALILLFLFIPFITDIDFYGRYLVPIMFLLLLIAKIPLRWKIVVIFFAILVFLAGFGARSNLIRFSVASVLGLLFYFRWFIREWIFKVIHAILILLPVILLVLAITDVFNIFKMNEYLEGDYTTTTYEGGEDQEASLTADTRTLLYAEVINSALKNNYVIMGRTPARGYDSVMFTDNLDLTGKAERFSSEVSIHNIFTWTGAIGVILYFLVFLIASFRAVYHSNSFFMKIIGLFVAFRWDYAFVEDFTTFDIQYMFVWLLIAMCYSTEFRKMNNTEFTYWIRGIFKKKVQISNLISVHHTHQKKGIM